MDEDQYEVYSIIIYAVNNRRSPEIHRLFFVTRSAGTCKSLLLSAIERALCKYRMNLLKLAPIGIAVVNISGQTIHSGLYITTCGAGNKLTSFIISMHRSDHQSDDLKNVEILLIDEISMVSSELLSFISVHFSRLYGGDRTFGGIMVEISYSLYRSQSSLSIALIFGASSFRCFPLFLVVNKRIRHLSNC